METVAILLGKWGIIGLVGLVVFLYAYKNSIKIFEWVENQTYGTKNYILERCEFLFIEVKSPDRITYVLLFLSVGQAVIVLGICGLFGRWGLGIFLGMILSFLGWKIPKPFFDYLVQKRITAYRSQMVDALTLLANGLRAGLSVPQSIGMVVDEMTPPISQEYNLILQQNRIGVPLEECFENLVKRVPTEDNEMFVSSINILRETGGNLAEVFDTIVGVIRERIRLQQKIETYIATGMFQGITIFLMPFVMGLIFFVSEPEMMMPMFESPIGYVVIALALLLDIGGLMVIFKIVKIKV